jgi:hypothetical protein
LLRLTPARLLRLLLITTLLVGLLVAALLRLLLVAALLRLLLVAALLRLLLVATLLRLHAWGLTVPSRCWVAAPRRISAPASRRVTARRLTTTESTLTHSVLRRGRRCPRAACGPQDKEGRLPRGAFFC